MTDSVRKVIPLTPSDLAVVRMHQAQREQLTRQAEQVESRAKELRDRALRVWGQALAIVCASHQEAGKAPPPEFLTLKLERDDHGPPRLEWDEPTAKPQDLAGAAALKSAVGELGKEGP